MQSIRGQVILNFIITYSVKIVPLMVRVEPCLPITILWNLLKMSTKIKPHPYRGAIHTDSSASRIHGDVFINNTQPWGVCWLIFLLHISTLLYVNMAWQTNVMFHFCNKQCFADKTHGTLAEWSPTDIFKIPRWLTVKALELLLIVTHL